MLDNERKTAENTIKILKIRFPEEKLWIHLTNFFLLISLIVFSGLAANSLSNSRWQFFPISLTEPMLIYLYIAPLVQACIVVCGSVGIEMSMRWLLILYWWSMIAMTIGDVVVGISCAFRLRAVHKVYDSWLKITWKEKLGDSFFCEPWNKLQHEFQCCGPVNPEDWFSIERYCGEEVRLDNKTLPLSCCSNSDGGCSLDQSYPEGCHYFLLDWMHGQSYQLFFVGYCLIFAIKLTFVFAMRHEFHEIMHIIDEKDQHYSNLELWETPRRPSTFFQQMVRRLSTVGMSGDSPRSSCTQKKSHTLHPPSFFISAKTPPGSPINRCLTPRSPAPSPETETSPPFTSTPTEITLFQSPSDTPSDSPTKCDGEYPPSAEKDADLVTVPKVVVHSPPLHRPKHPRPSGGAPRNPRVEQLKKSRFQVELNPVDTDSGTVCSLVGRRQHHSIP